MCESLATRNYRRLHSSLQASHTELDLHNIKMHSFKIYGIWPQATKHTHAHAQSSNASVGLAQAHPNYTCILSPRQLFPLENNWD